MSPSIPTATESPGRFSPVRCARTICRAFSTAPADFGEGAEWATVGTFAGFGCRGVAVTLTKTQSPGIATSSSPTAASISMSQVGIRPFRIFPPVNSEPYLPGHASGWYRCLVLRRLRHLVDHQHIRRSLRRVQFQAELCLECGEQIWEGVRTRRGSGALGRGSTRKLEFVG